jgi:hypothetical protein
MNSFHYFAYLISAVSIILSGCANTFELSGLARAITGASSVQSISLFADGDMNEGYPLAVDIVFVVEEKVLDSLSGLRSTEWFANKQDLMRHHQKGLMALSWELVPGQELPDILTPTEARSVRGVIIFANYLGNKTYRMLIKNEKKILIYFRRHDYDLIPG